MLNQGREVFMFGERKQEQLYMMLRRTKNDIQPKDLAPGKE